MTRANKKPARKPRAPERAPSAITGVEPVPDRKRDSELAEAWIRTIVDPDRRYIHGVGASNWSATSKWTCLVAVWALEIVRDDVVEAEFRRRIPAAIRRVRGVTDVAEEDRGVWAIAGAPSGTALVRAVGEVVDDLAPRALAVVQQTR